MYNSYSLVGVLARSSSTIYVNVEYTNLTHILCKINRKYTATNHVTTAEQKVSAQSSLFTPIHDKNIYILIYINVTATAKDTK
jgi:hypothetical protein